MESNVLILITDSTLIVAQPVFCIPALVPTTVGVREVVATVPHGGYPASNKQSDSA